MTPLPDKATLLIVDDTPSNLGLAVRMFEERGYRILTAQDGEEGLQRARLTKPDLILLDVMMPGMDGFDVCQRLKSDPETLEIPVLFMTSLASVEHKVKGFKAGAVDYLTKPLQVEEVMARVGTHLRLHAARQKLSEQNAELCRYREELEKRVADRTAELAEREREFRTLVENAPDEISRYDRLCRYVYCNPQHERSHGMRLHELTGRTPVECFPESPEAVAFQKSMAAVIASGETAVYETALPHHVDRTRFLNILLVAELDVDGEVIGVLAIGRDVTRQKTAKRELLLLNHALDSSFDATYLMDSKLNLRYVNEAACRALGYDREELRTMRLFDIDPRVTDELMHELMSRTLDAGRYPGTVESTHRRKDGTCFPVEIGATAFLYEDETLYLTTVRDITQRKATEHLLHEQEQAIRAAVEHSPDAITRYDERMQRIYANPASERMHGMTSDELGQAIFGRLQKVDGGFAFLMRSVFITGEELGIELPFMDDSGNKGWADVRVVPEFGADGHVMSVLTIGRDITERMRVEEMLREERGMFVGGPIVVFKWLAEAGWPVDYVSPNVLEQFGYSAFQLTSDDFRYSSIIHPDDLRHLSEGVECYLSEGRATYEQEYRIARADGVYRWVYDFTIVSRREDGSVSHFLGYLMDITDQKRVEEELLRYQGQLEELVQERTRELQESEAHLRALIDNLPFEFWAMDTDLRYSMLNANSLANYGNVVGKTLDELGLPEAMVAEWVEMDSRVLGGETLHGQYEKNVEGDVRFFDSLIAPVRVDETIIGIVGVSIDITERKRAEEKRNELQRRLQIITENLPGALCHYRIYPDGRGNMLYASPGLQELFGLTYQDLAEDITLMAGRIHPEDLPYMAEKMALAASEQQSYGTEFRVQHPEKGEIWVRQFSTPVYDSEHSMQWYGLMFDITERKRSEEQILRMNEALEQRVADRTVELQESREQLRGLAARREDVREEERKYIAREVHDELGQVLTGLKLNISLLQHGQSDSDQGQREQLRDAVRLIDRALEVARNVASALRPASLDMGIASALEWLASRFSTNTNIQCDVIVGEGSYELSERCAIALFRIAQESLTNCARYAEASHIEILLSSERDDYVLKVRDNGVGFDSGRHKMESFGLVGMRERAIMLSGSLVIESEPGAGTQVEVRIPKLSMENIG